KAQRDFLAVVARATPSLLVAVERDGTVAPQGVNYAFRELTGYTDGEAIGRRFWDLVAPPELVDEVKHAFEEQVETGVSMEHETAWIGSSGTWRIVAWWLRPLEESGKVIVCGTAITECKAPAAALTDRGLPAALEALAARAPLPVELSADLQDRLPGPVEAAAYYVVAEALTNVAKYSEASAVEVHAERLNGRVVVEVADDGIG